MTGLARSSYERQPVLAVCGYSGSGKTTLLEQLVPRLRRRGLRVAVLKHDAHGISVDTRGKDSDRIFRAGADVVISAPGEELWRCHQEDRLAEVLALLLAYHDLVLVEGYKTAPLTKVWLASATESDPPAEVEQVAEVLAWNEPRLARMEALLECWLLQIHSRRPRYGSILVGGQSSRMGSPKQLLVQQGVTLMERVYHALSPVVEKVVVAGQGQVPESLAELTRLADIPDSEGPLAGIVACQRWAPQASWFVAACDLLLIDTAAIEWLDAERRPGRWAVLPCLSQTILEPLLAVYEPQSVSLLEKLVRDRQCAPRYIAGHPAVACPAPPPHLASAWTNVNTQQELRSLAKQGHQ
jgi:molybdopterin-guanine dinucleotide biosynthesis protein MobB